MSLILGGLLKGALKLTGNLYLLYYLNKTSRSLKRLHARSMHHVVSGQISDLTHQLTSPLYKYLLQQNLLHKIALAFMIIHINLSILVIFVKSILYNRVLFVISGVYISKFILNTLYQSTPPHGRYNADYVPNRKLHWSNKAQTETFFSGHTSLCALAFLYSPLILRNYMLVGFSITILLIIILRIHYIIDVVGALLVVYFFDSVLNS